MCTLLLIAPSLVFGQTERPLPAGKISALIVSGANNHDWQWTHRSLHSILVESGRFSVDITLEPSKAFANLEALRKYQVFVLDYNGPDWGETAKSNFLTAVREGVGVTVIHAANNAFDGWAEYEALVGLCWRKGTGHGRFHEFDVRVTDRDHPITRNLADLVAHPDELYHRLVPMPGAEFRVLATAKSSEESGGTGEDEPMATVATYGWGRIFHTPLGHVWPGSESSRVSQLDPQFRNLVVRGTEWAATGDVVEGSPLNTLSQSELNDGWQLLFDGQTTAGWRGFKKDSFPEKGWKVDNGTLRVLAKGGGGDLVTVRRYQDFELALEWKVSPGANSGIMYRVSEEDSATYRTGPEYQVLDDSAFGFASSASTSAGGLYALYSPQGKIVRPIGQFNQARILVSRGKIEHWLNGRLLLKADMNSAEWKKRVAESKFGEMPLFGTVRNGFLALQDHGNDVWYRNIKIRRLPPIDVDSSPPTVLFNQKDLSGWTFHLRDGGAMEEVWSVRDDILVCKGNPVGYLRTEKDYTNFVLRLEWRFDPVTRRPGNSGVLLRMIGEDKVWPRSIEAQLQSGRAGDFWNIGEFPMKTDAKRLRGRNTRHLRSHENPVGEWNQYEIIVNGPTVSLRVNGQVLNEAYDCLETPGKICLQSEGTEIHFRNIHLWPIEASSDQ